MRRRADFGSWAMVLACAAASAAVAAPGPTGPPSPSGPAPAGVFILDAPSEVGVQNPLLGPNRCVPLRVLTRKGLGGPFSLTTTGLGDAGLYPGRACDGTAARVLLLSGSDADLAYDVSLRPDAAATEDAGDKLQGRIVAIGAAGEAASIALTVRQHDPPWLSISVGAIKTFFQALLWVLGVFIPAVITYYVARRNAAADRAQKQQDDAVERAQKQQDDFRTFTGARVAQIVSLLSNDVAPHFFAKGVTDRAAMVWQDLSAAQIIANLPDDYREQLKAASLSGDDIGMLRILREILRDYLPSQLPLLEPPPP